MASTKSEKASIDTCFIDLNYASELEMNLRDYGDSCWKPIPFMFEYDEITQTSLAAIQMLDQADIKCTVLTKGILPIELANCSSDNEYGSTLISLNEDYRKKMKPYTATYQARLEAMKALHDAGCKTWVSIEPYPTPNLINQRLDELLEKISFTEKIIFGRTNYCKEVSAYKQHKKFYNEQAEYVIEFCKKRNILYHIKEKTITAE